MKSGKPKIALGLIGLIGLALTTSACGESSGGGAAASVAEMEEVNLTFQSQASPEHPHGVAQKAFAEEVAERTNGKVKIEIYFSGSLLAGDADLGGLESGVADLGALFITYHPQTLPVANWFTQMQSLRSHSAPHGFIQGTAALQKVAETSEALQQEADEHNVVFLGISSGAINYGLLCKEPINSLDDAKGVKVRVGGTVWADEVKAMGMTPISLPFSESYEALQRGVTDCEWGDPTTIAAFGLWDVAKFYHPVAGSPSGSTYLTANKDTWDSLPPDAQEIIQNANVNFNVRVTEAGLEGYKDFVDRGEEKGVTIVDPRPLNELLQAYQQRLIEEELVNRAPAGVTDPEEFIKAWRSALESGMDLAIESAGTEPNESQAPEDIRDGYLSGADAVDLQKFSAALSAGS